MEDYTVTIRYHQCMYVGSRGDLKFMYVQMSCT